VLAGDRHGLSFYGYDSICNLLQMSVDQYLQARNALIEKDLIDFDGTIFQVLDLPSDPPAPSSQSFTRLIQSVVKEVPA
jgi:hypothetical protein